MKCPACKEIRDQHQRPQDLENTAPDPPANAVVSADVAPRRRGRPKAGQAVPQLLPWVQANRGDIYRHIDGPRYLCLACNHEVYFVRTSLSAKAFLDEHESYQKHQRGLQNLRSSGPQPMVQEQRKRCQGLQLEDAAGDLGRMKEPCVWEMLDYVRLCKYMQVYVSPF